MKTTLNTVTLSLALALTACGSKPATSSAQAKDASAPALKLSCTMIYADTAIQPNPLFKKTFEPSPTATQSSTELFGITPGDGVYFASVGLNDTQTGGVVLMVSKADGPGALGLVPVEFPKQQLVTLTLSPQRYMSLSCMRK